MRTTIWTGTMLAITLLAALSSAGVTGNINGRVVDAQTGQAIVGAVVMVEGTNLATRTRVDGTYTIPDVPTGSYTVRVVIGTTVIARQQVSVTAGATVILDFGASHLRDFKLKDEGRTRQDAATLEECAPQTSTPSKAGNAGYMMKCQQPPVGWSSPGFESYDNINENDWHAAVDDPLSTFSIDVDAASYGNVRRFITTGQLPPVDAVRIEELINYFDYDYPDPRGRHPFSITTEVAECPWNRGNYLVHVGLQGKRIDVEELPPSNIVFLLDVSGSMNQPNKLPLLQSSFRLLVETLRPQDQVAIVVYAGAAGLVLPSTSGADKERILCAIDRLRAGGSTAGGAGIQLAYQVAQENFLEDGNNRIILATDGDFNVGMSSDGDMVRLIEDKRRSGVFLTVLGFGEGNLKDSKMEKIADKGNGHYAYIDNIIEARKVLINELGATLLTIAKDVKLQVEFNPARVASYRLIGYENRVLENRDFDDDTKDAGELGAGHSVTALYEITLNGRGSDRTGRPLKYSDARVPERGRFNDELLTVSFRYKPPTGSESRLLTQVVKDDMHRFADASETFRFSAAVVEFGLVLRGSSHRGTATMAHAIETARASRGDDRHGYRAEFVSLAETAELLMHPVVGERR